MKYLLVPLLIVGMFMSYSAAGLAMLFYTGTVASAAELVALVRGDVDHTRLSNELLEPEDELSQLATVMEAYRAEYESGLDSLAFERASLASVMAEVVSMRAAMDAEAERLGLLADSTGRALKRQRIALLAPAFDKIKAADAAQILTEGTVADTTVALLMFELQPRQVAKILGSMDVAWAAQVTNLMQEVAQP